MKSKYEGMTYIVELPLVTNFAQEDWIERQYAATSRIYNAIVNKAKKLYQKMLKESDYVRLRKQYSRLKKSKDNENKTKNQLKELASKMNTIRKDFLMTEFGFNSIAKEIRYCGKESKKGKGFSNLIDSSQIQYIASCAFKAFEAMMFSNADISYRKLSDCDFLRGTTNSMSYIFNKDDMTLKSTKLGKMKLLLKDNDIYKKEALSQHICYCGIKRKIIKGRRRYFAQITVKGDYPQSYKQKHPLGVGNVGIDIGTSSIAISGINEAAIMELNPKIDKNNRKKVLLQRKLDRQRRANNPECYNKDGTFKRGMRASKYSNRMNKTKKELDEINRKEKVYKNLFKYDVANKVVETGSAVVIEDMNFAALAKRASKTEISEKTGRYKKKKRFGKSIQIHNPAEIQNTIKFKMEISGGSYEKIDNYKIKASQYHHDTGEFIPAKLNERYKIINGEIIQRDLYSSFILMNVDVKNMKIDQRLCDKYWKEFIDNHKNAIINAIDTGVSKTLRDILGKEIIKTYS